MIRQYNPAANPNANFFPGVPLADLTDDQFQTFRPDLQASIDRSGYWTKVDDAQPAPVAEADVPAKAKSKTADA